VRDEATGAAVIINPDTLDSSQVCGFVANVLGCPPPWRLEAVERRLRPRYPQMSDMELRTRIATVLVTASMVPQMHQNMMYLDERARPDLTAVSPLTRPFSPSLILLLRTWAFDNNL
jgi:hypothetical protein